MQEFLRAFDALPMRAFTGTAHGRRYVVVKSGFAGGASQKLVAENLGRTDYINLNLYRARTGALLRPNEMPQAKVIAFVLDLVPDAPDAPGACAKQFFIEPNRRSRLPIGTAPGGHGEHFPAIHPPAI